jgi:hypothetical protein
MTPLGLAVVCWSLLDQLPKIPCQFWPDMPIHAGSQLSCEVWNKLSGSPCQRFGMTIDSKEHVVGRLIGLGDRLLPPVFRNMVSFGVNRCLS